MNKIFDNQSIQKIQQNIKKSKPLVIRSDDTSANIKSKYGNKYLDDISDSDDERTSYRKRNSDIINKLPEKNNSGIKKLDSDNLSIKSLKKPDSIKKIKESLFDLEKDNKSQEKIEEKTTQEENSESGYESLEEYEFKQDFENEVKVYVKTDNQIAELQKQIKELNQIKKNAENNIVKHLERLGETNINITGGKLIVNKYSSKASFKEDIVKEVLQKEIKDQKTIETIFDKIQEVREENSKIQIGLKRTKAKK